MVNDDVPGADILKEAGEYQIFTQNGMGVSFRSLFETPLRGHNSHLTRLLVVFIRHFFCGVRFLPWILPLVFFGCVLPILITSRPELPGIHSAYRRITGSVVSAGRSVSRHRRLRRTQLDLIVHAGDKLSVPSLCGSGYRSVRPARHAPDAQPGPSRA